MQTTRGASLSDAEEPDESGATSPDGAAAGRSRVPRRITPLVVIGLLALTLDIASKIIVVEQLSDRHPIRLLGGLLTLRVTRNSGAAFSIGTGATLLFTVIAAVVIIAIIRTARNLRSLPWAIALGLLLGGAMGNLIDRLLRSPAPLQGHVVDWIELPHWPVFNVADSAIVCGGILAVVLAARGYQLDGGRVPAKGKGESESDSVARPQAAPSDEESAK